MNTHARLFSQVGMRFVAGPDPLVRRFDAANRIAGFAKRKLTFAKGPAKATPDGPPPATTNRGDDDTKGAFEAPLRGIDTGKRPVR
jgi:hypothetical protein